MSSVLCGADFCILILSIQVMRQQPSNCTGTIATLPQQLQDLGCSLEHQEIAVETDRMFRSYSRKPNPDAGKQLRDDILEGVTACWRLHVEYSTRQTETADYYMDRGVAPVFLAWPRSIMNCDQEEFNSRVFNALIDNVGPHCVKFLGRAFGSLYCYLDLLLFDVYSVVEFVEKYFSKIPGGDSVRIQSFYYDAAPCPVSRAYLKEHNMMVAGIPVLYDGSVRKAPQKPKEKKKNAAKAKRKHSQKHR